MKVTVITPIYHTPFWKLKRAIASVKGQTHSDWEHIICTDGYFDEEISNYVKMDFRIKYINSKERLGHYGAGVRNYCLQFSEGDAVCFLDADNVLLAEYMEKMSGRLEKFDMVISPTIWFKGNRCKVLFGNPQENEIDTIQVMAKTSVMKEHGFILNGYTSDGKTYESMSKRYSYSHLMGEPLSIHF